MPRRDTTSSAHSDSQSTDWLTPGEAAARVPGGIAVRTIQRWADQGRIPHITLPNGHRRFRSADIDALHQDPGALADEHPEPANPPSEIETATSTRARGQKAGAA